MGIQRQFLGWDEPAVEKVGRHLVPDGAAGPVDLEGTLIVVPTRQVGRRLRAAMARRCADRDTALLSARVVTPSFLLNSAGPQEKEASDAVVRAAWAELLRQVDVREFAGLFPAEVPDRDFPWALNTGEMIQRLRDTLAEGGYRIADVPETGKVEEAERWESLARLEQAFLARLKKEGLVDPCLRKIRLAEKPAAPEGVRRIVMAAVPDPTPLVVKILAGLSKKLDIEILVHAPDAVADRFDEWGRPVEKQWGDALIEIPEPGLNLLPCASPAAQGRKAIELIAEEAGRFGPADIAIGAPDSAVIPFLEADLSEGGLRAYDPAGKPLRETPLFRLLDGFRALVGEGAYADAAAFLRHPDVLAHLERDRGVSPARLLAELDEFQNTYLPPGFDELLERLAKARSGAEGERAFPNLARAIAFLKEAIADFGRGDFPAAVRKFLQTVFGRRKLDRHGDAELMAAADLVDKALHEIEAFAAGRLLPERRHALELLVRLVADQRFSLERDKALVDLEGWLELPWNDAPFLLVTGMNEGYVPESRLGDVFLPDSLVAQLGLRSEADRFARDVYFMRVLVETRRGRGRAAFLTGRTGTRGDPLKPSRLLFRCPDAELPDRVRHLFGEADERRENVPLKMSFRLDPGPPPELRPEELQMKKLHVTSFRDYLACPFRFYLKHILKMEGMDDQMMSMDAMDFGNLVHDALRRMADEKEMRTCRHPKQLGDFLRDAAEDWVNERFGKSRPLAVSMQLEAAQQRLVAAAHVQADLAEQGWEIQEAEVSLEMELGGITVSGRIDRIDRNAETGLIRVMDYKTSDKAEDPAAAHFATVREDTREYALLEFEGKDKRWKDLQLPLYGLLLRAHGRLPSPCELGYFSLPKALTKTDVLVGQGFNTELLYAAERCAKGVIEDIRARRFWPPAERIEYDDFEALFPASAEECFDGRRFLERLRA